MKRSWTVAVSAAVVAVLTAANASSAKEGFVPRNGFVPDAATARRIAEAVWIPLYGAKESRPRNPSTSHCTATCGRLAARTCPTVGWVALQKPIFRRGTVGFSESSMANRSRRHNPSLQRTITSVASLPRLLAAE
jgi:hypothetical protein